MNTLHTAFRPSWYPKVLWKNGRMEKIRRGKGSPLTIPQVLASAVLRAGPIPNHVALIMDGRYAKKLGHTAIKGHEKGRNVLEDVVLFALALKIPVMTLYAFSIENLKRTEEEVENLTKLFQKFVSCLAVSENSGLGKFGVRFQVLGNWDFIPDRLKPYIAKLHYHSRQNPESKLLVNLAVGYTSRDAMYRSYEAIVDGHEFLSPCDVTEGLFQELHSIFPIPPVDLLIRTGGDTRLSDFMLWESTYAHIEFLDITWPEFTFWELWKTIFRYQVTPRGKDPRKNEPLTKKQLEFIEKQRDKMWEEMASAVEKYEEVDSEVLEIKINWVQAALNFILSG